MEEEGEIYNDAVCVQKDNGKYECKLYKERMFEPISPSEEKPAIIKMPEGEFSAYGEQYRVKSKRKHDIATDIDDITIYNASSVNIEEGGKRIEIEPSIRRIMRCKVVEGEKKLLRCSCEEAVYVYSDKFIALMAIIGVIGLLYKVKNR